MSTNREVKFDHILDAAIEAIAESGYHQCTVSRIAALAGVATGTIYLYFKNKEEILIRLFQVRMGQFIERIRSQLVHCANTRERLKTIITMHLSYMEQNRSLAIVTEIELRQSDPRVRQAVTEPLMQYFSLIEEVIRQGIEKEEVVVPYVRVARQMIFGALEQATTDWVWSGGQKPLLGEAEEMLQLFAGALRLKE